MPVLVPMFPVTATLAGEVFVTLADPDRVVLPGVEPRVLRPGVARYARQRLACMHLNVSGGELVSPGRATIRRVAVAPNPAVPDGQMLEVSLLPFGLEPVLQRLRGLPTFYLTPFAAAPADDSLVTMGQNLAAGVTIPALVAAVFPDGLQVSPPVWMQMIEDALRAAGDDGVTSWSDRRNSLYNGVRRCRVLDHAGRPLAEDSDPAVSKTFTVRRRMIAGDAQVAERSVTLGADSDLQAALSPPEPGNPIDTLVAPADQYTEVSWAGAPPNDADVSIPMLALYETRTGAVPLEPELGVAILRLPDGPAMPPVTTLQVLDLARWFAPLAPGTSDLLRRFRANSQVEPLIDGLATFQRLAADLVLATGAGNGAQLAAWTLNRFPLDPTVSEHDIVDLLTHIHDNEGMVRVLATSFVNLKNPDLPASRFLAVLFVFLLSEAAFVAAVTAKHQGDLDSDAIPLLAFFLAPVIVSALAAAVASGDGFEWLFEEIGESAKSTVDAINELAPKLATYAVNQMRIADNPLADTLGGDPLFGLEEDVDQFSVFHNKSQMVKRPPAGDDNGFIGYLGGIDINKNRLDSPGHGVAGAYHDVHARVTGPIVRDLFQSFSERWAYQRTTETGLPEGTLPTPPITDDGPDGAAGTLRPSQHVARIGRTYHGPVGPLDPPLTYAPQGDAGIYHTLVAAMKSARDHIYIEDQYFTPDDPFVDVLLAAREHCKRLIILLPGETDQPYGDNRRRMLLERLSHATTGWGDRMLVGYPQRRGLLRAAGRVASRGRCSLARTCGESDDALIVAPPARVLATPFWMWVNGELMLAHSTLNVDEGGNPATQVRVIRGSTTEDPRWDATPRPHLVGSAVTMSSVRGVYVHAKTMMIDDTFVSIGSCNLNRRGFFSDGEINVFAIPQQLRGAPDNPARALRTALWAEHLGLPPAMGPVLLEDAVAGFELFRRAHNLGNRFTPLHATDPRSQFSISEETILPLSVAGMIGTVLGNLPFAAQFIYRRIWNLVIDAPSRTDETPTEGPV